MAPFLLSFRSKRVRVALPFFVRPFFERFREILEKAALNHSEEAGKLGPGSQGFWCPS